MTSYDEAPATGLARKRAKRRTLVAEVSDASTAGYRYTSLREGDGPSPTATDVVKVNYEGRLTNGTVFDSSYSRGEPAEFPLNQVIPCWTRGVREMKVGGRAELLCPPDLAYGDRGAPPDIPGGATLIFKVELLAIKGRSASQPAPAETEPAPAAPPDETQKKADAPWWKQQ